MDIMNKTSSFIELICMDAQTSKDLCTKYSILADAYAGSAGKDIVNNNKDTFEILLSANIVDYMIYSMSSGSLSDAIASNNKLAEILNPSSPVCVTKIAKELSNSGWHINKEVSLSSLQNALNMWGIQLTEDIDGAELLGEDTGDTPDIDFDDADLDGYADGEANGDTNEDIEDFEVLGDYIGEESAAVVTAANLFSGTVNEQFETVRTGVDDDDEEIGLVERPIKFDPNITKAEKEAAAVAVKISDVLDNDGIGDSTPKWAKDGTGMEDGLDDLPGEIDSMITSIIQRIEGVMRTCFELDRPYGIITDKGLVKYHTDKVKNTLVLDAPVPQGGLSEMEMLYKMISQSAGVKLVPAPDNRFVPNYDNITGKSDAGDTKKFDYYPGQMLKYALGFVDGKRHSTWRVFEEELRKSLKKKFNEFYKKTNKDGVSEYYTFRDKIIQIYSNSMLVIAYSSSGMTIRTSLVGMTDTIEAQLTNLVRKTAIMTNSKVTVFPVSGYRDVVDIQIISDPETVLGKPSWAYKALKVKLDNGEAPSLSEGLPIGKKINGEIVEFKLDTSSRFMIFVAAGSGSGKGVLTLSLAAATLGSGIPLFYTDFKPDMAPIFWEMANKLNVPNCYSYDANVRTHKNEINSPYTLGATIPEYIYKELGEFSGAMLYLRSIALMCAMADYRNQHGFNDNGMMFVFDEIQAMQKLICNMVNKITIVYEANKPPADSKKDYDGDRRKYEYCLKMLHWLVDVDAGLQKYADTTGRAGAIFTMFIGQNATAEVWNNLKPKVKIGKGSAMELPFMSRLLKAGTVTKLMGKGTSASNYGLGGANITSDEQMYITKYRYFAIYDGPDAGKADVQAFKPFLTLNYDDIFAKCWTNGVGKTYGYKSPGEGASREQMMGVNEAYVKNMQEAFPGEEGYSNELGIHPGVGLLGLASMYCKGDVNVLRKSLSNSNEKALDFFRESGLNNKYDSVEKYMYSMGETDWLSQLSMCDYRNASDEEQPWEDAEATDESAEAGGDTGLFMGDIEPTTQKSKTTVGTFDVPSEFNAQASSPEAVPKEVLEMQRRKLEFEKAEQYTQRQPISNETATQVDSASFEGSDEDFPDEQVFKNESGFSNSNYSEASNTSYSGQQAQPQYMPPTEETIYQKGGKTGRVVYVTPDKTTQVLGLTKDNSIVITMPETDTAEKFSKKLFSGLWGAQYEFKSRWKAILDGVGSKKSAALITRATILEDAIVFNKKMVATINILGGDEDIRIEDIVNFSMTAKQFVNIREIILDTTIFERAQAELGDPINKLFSIFTQLNKLCIIEDGCGAPKINVTRQQIMQNQVENQAQEAMERAQFKNQMEAVSAAKNPNLKTKSPGYQSRVWESSKNFQGQGWGAARDALLEKNPKLFKAAGLGLVSLGVLGVGAIFGAIGKVGSMFRL